MGDGNLLPGEVISASGAGISSGPVGKRSPRVGPGGGSAAPGGRRRGRCGDVKSSCTCPGHWAAREGEAGETSRFTPSVDRALFFAA